MSRYFECSVCGSLNKSQFKGQCPKCQITLTRRMLKALPKTLQGDIFCRVVEPLEKTYGLYPLQLDYPGFTITLNMDGQWVMEEKGDE